MPKNNFSKQTTPHSLGVVMLENEIETPNGVVTHCEPAVVDMSKDLPTLDQFPTLDDILKSGNLPKRVDCRLPLGDFEDQYQRNDQVAYDAYLRASEYEESQTADNSTPNETMIMLNFKVTESRNGKRSHTKNRGNTINMDSRFSYNSIAVRRNYTTEISRKR